MKKWGQRVRAAIGMGLTWGAAWFGAGILLARVPGFYSDLPFALLFAPLGFVTGDRRRSVRGARDRDEVVLDDSRRTGQASTHRSRQQAMRVVGLTLASTARGPTDAASHADRWSARQQQASLGRRRTARCVRIGRRAISKAAPAYFRAAATLCNANRGPRSTRILAQSASAFAGFVARNKKRLARNEACSSRLDVTGISGKTTVEVSYRLIVNEIARALEQVIARAIALPEAKPLLPHLRWTFYREPAPVYAQSEDDAAEVAAPFLTWCVFAAEEFAPLTDAAHLVRRCGGD